MPIRRYEILHKNGEVGEEGGASFPFKKNSKAIPNGRSEQHPTEQFERSGDERIDASANEVRSVQ